MSLAERIKQAKNSKIWQITETIELDGISYSFVGYVNSNNEVGWHVEGTPRHTGQHSMIGFHGDKDNGDHEHCGMCAGYDDFWTDWHSLSDQFLKDYSVEYDPTITF